MARIQKFVSPAKVKMQLTFSIDIKTHLEALLSFSPIPDCMFSGSKEKL